MSTHINYKYGRSSFFKLYFASSKIIPPSRIYLFYQGRPLYGQATFRNDRYSFELPRILEEKMLAGALIADFHYADLPGELIIARTCNRVPRSIVLSDRYE